MLALQADMKFIYLAGMQEAQAPCMSNRHCIMRQDNSKGQDWRTRVRTVGIPDEAHKLLGNVQLRQAETKSGALAVMCACQVYRRRSAPQQGQLPDTARGLDLQRVSAGALDTDAFGRAKQPRGANLEVCAEIDCIAYSVHETRGQTSQRKDLASGLHGQLTEALMQQML